MHITYIDTERLHIIRSLRYWALWVRDRLCQLIHASNLFQFGWMAIFLLVFSLFLFFPPLFRRFFFNSLPPPFYPWMHFAITINLRCITADLSRSPHTDYYGFVLMFVMQLLYFLCKWSAHMCDHQFANYVKIRQNIAKLINVKNCEHSMAFANV